MSKKEWSKEDWPGIRWEYFVVGVNDMDISPEHLDRLGNEGWELATAMVYKGVRNELIFKRPVLDGEEEEEQEENNE